ncbi:MAG: HEAT repeat domain-containing protein, partial [Bryobacteraceae bacterium]
RQELPVPGDSKDARRPGRPGVNCSHVQKSLSLYLYGEIGFAEEEALERHVAECAFCARALAHEKNWHSTLNAEQKDVPLDLLASCRADLLQAASVTGSRRPLRWGWPRWLWANAFHVPSSSWSRGVAAASFLLFIGFTAGRWTGRNGAPGAFANSAREMSLFQPEIAHVRDIQQASGHRVRIIVDQIRQREITGSVSDAPVRRLLLTAIQEAGDPGIRVDSVEVLAGDDSKAVRRALVRSAERDPNAAVRLKAVEALQPFAYEPSARAALVSVLENDDDPGVRTEAIDALAPVDTSIGFDPQLAGTLEHIAQSPEDGDYLRMRCLQILGEMQASLGVQ